MTTTSAVMTALNTIELHDHPIRPAAAHEAVVQVEAVGVCGSDTSYFTTGRVGNYIVNGQIVLGHEASGLVIAVGDDVESVSVGDRVAIEPGTPCRNCKQCMAGRYHLCPDLVFLATPPYDGALSKHITIDARNLFTIPDHMTYEEAALLEPLSVGIWAVQRANLQAGDNVLVTGAGPVGLLAAMAAQALGAGSVTITDVSDFRLDFAQNLGFSTEHSESPASTYFDVLIECSGAPGVLEAGLGRLAPAGRAAVVGMSKSATIPLPLGALNPQEISIHLVNRYAHTWPIAIGLVSSGRINVAPLVTHSYGLADSAQALLASRTHQDAVKAVIYPQR